MTILARATVILGADIIGLTRKLNEAEQRVRQAGERMQEIGGRLSTYVTLPILAAGAASVKMAADFDESMRKIAALTTTSREQVNAWREDVRALAVELGKSPAEAAEALFFITSAGIEGEHAMEALRAALTASAIGLGETQTIAFAAGSAMNAYADAGLTATRATEILAAAIKFGSFEAAQLAPVIGDVVGTASALKIGLDNVAGVLAVFSRTGTSASEGATQLNSIMSVLLGTSAEGEKILNTAGLSLKELRDVASGPGGLIAVMRILDESLSLEQLRVVIPNIRAFRGVMNALAQNAEVVDQIMAGTADSVGFLDKALKESMGPMFELRVAWARLKDALIEAGDVMIPIVVPAINAISHAVRALAELLGNLPTALQRVLVVMALIVAAVGPLMVTLGALIKLLPAGMALFSGLVGPILLAAAAIGALVAAGMAVAEHWVWLKQQAVALWTLIKDVFFTGIEFVLDKLIELGDLIEDIPDVAKRALPGFGIISNAMMSVSNAALSMRAGVREAHEGMLVDAGATLSKLEAELLGVADAASGKSGKGGKGDKGGSKPPVWIAALSEAATELAASLDLARRMEAALGDAFDESEARIKAFEHAITSAIANKVPVTNAALQGWIAQLRTMQSAAETAAFSLQLNLEIELRRITAAIESAKDPLAAYNAELSKLQEQLALGLISWEQYIERVKAAKDAFDGVAAKANDVGEQINQALADTAGRAVDEFVDGLVGAGQSFGEFVAQMLLDIGKLILKLELLKLLFPNAGPGGLGSIFGIGGHAHGGFIAAGGVGLVGEQGPELISAGHGGLTVTPMPAQHAASPGEMNGGITVPVSIPVAAMDSRDVQRFFAENEGLVASAVTRAVQKSMALRRLLGRG